MRPLSRTLLALALLGRAASLHADVVQLLDGDRISGRATKRRTTVTIRTPYGSLTIPHAKIARIVYDDGREDVLNALLQPAAPPGSASARLLLEVTGQAFWYAWEPPKDKPVDPTLRLQVSLDDETVASYLDATPDPRDLPNALVNSFSFEPEVVQPAAAGGARVLPPETRLGRALLAIELPAGRSRRQRLRLAYQINEGTSEAPAWRDCAEGTLELELREGAATSVHIGQERGQMEFSGLLRRKMKRVETFRIEARPEQGGEPGAP